MYCKPGDIFIHCPRTAFVIEELETKNRSPRGLITDVNKIQQPLSGVVISIIAIFLLVH